MFFSYQSEYIDNGKKYSIVRIIPKWSKSISLIGLTVAIFDGNSKTIQTSVRKKYFENLMSKWSEDI